MKAKTFWISLTGLGIIIGTLLVGHYNSRMEAVAASSPTRTISPTPTRASSSTPTPFPTRTPTLTPTPKAPEGFGYLEMPAVASIEGNVEAAIIEEYGSLEQVPYIQVDLPEGSVEGRIQGANGWLAPVPSNILSSDEDDHLRRNSVNSWDLTVPEGTVAYPMAAGVVIYAGCNNAGGYGCWVYMRHENGYSSVYAHFQRSLLVHTGQEVAQSTPLGRIGWTGLTSFGPHVHWEIRQGGAQVRIDRYFDRDLFNYCPFCNAGE